MLSKTLDESMEKAFKYENLTKASKFGDVKRNVYSQKSQEKEIEMLQKISEYVKEKPKEKAEEEDTEILEYITENPDKIAPIFDFSDRPSTGLPFFKSIDYKLSEIFSV